MLAQRVKVLLDIHAGDVLDHTLRLHLLQDQGAVNKPLCGPALEILAGRQTQRLQRGHIDLALQIASQQHVSVHYSDHAV